MSWPGHIKDPGGIRTQFHHVIDIVPTILEATGIPAPLMVNGVAQKPIEGVSMAYTWDPANATAKSHRTTQYFEMFGARALYHDGWIAATPPPAAGVADGHVRRCRTGRRTTSGSCTTWTRITPRANDLAAKNPEKLRELQDMFMMEAAKYKVLPMDNSILTRLITPRPSATAGRMSFTYSGTMPDIPPGDAPKLPQPVVYHHGRGGDPQGRREAACW